MDTTKEQFNEEKEVPLENLKEYLEEQFGVGCMYQANEGVRERLDNLIEERKKLSHSPWEPCNLEKTMEALIYGPAYQPFDTNGNVTVYCIANQVKINEFLAEDLPIYIGKHRFDSYCEYNFGCRVNKQGYPMTPLIVVTEKCNDRPKRSKRSPDHYVPDNKRQRRQ